MPPCLYALRPMGLYDLGQLEGRTLLFIAASSGSTCLMLVWYESPSCSQTSPGADPSWTPEAAELSAPQVFASTEHAHLQPVSLRVRVNTRRLSFSVPGGHLFQEPRICLTPALSRIPQENPT